MGEKQSEYRSLRSIIVGSVALLLLSIIKPDTFFDFILWAVTGSILSTFFLIPVDRTLITGELRIQEVAGFLVGAVIFVFMFLFVYESVMEGIVFVLEWIVTYHLVSLFVVLLERILP